MKIHDHWNATKLNGIGKWIWKEGSNSKNNEKTENDDIELFSFILISSVASLACGGSNFLENLTKFY